MSEDENTTEIEGIYINFWCHDWRRIDNREESKGENEGVKLTLEEKSQRTLITIDYSIPHSYAHDLEDYIKEYFIKGKTHIKVKIKGKLEENKYKYEGTGLIKKLE